MNLNIKKFLTYFSITFLAACSSAKKAAEISPVYIPSTTYSNMTCSQLAQEAEVFRQRIPQAEAAVEKHYSDQKTTEVVAWLLFAPAVFLYDGGQKQSTDLAVLKGQLDAVRQAQMNKKC
jgi:hypothetical protein